jgi:malonyl-CoA O-methyltransferase
MGLARFLQRIAPALAGGLRGREAGDVLDVRSAYRLWAPTYQDETATSFLDEELARQMLAGLPSKRLLDAGCGIGRRIRNMPGAVGLDLSPEMLASGKAGNVIEGDVRSMPFNDDSFDMVWCRLVLGHLPDPVRAYREFARVSLPGGYIFTTDFHPDAVRAGHRRTLNDEAGKPHTIEHYVHTDHIELAASAGLIFVDQRNATVGPSVREFYERGIGRKAYWRDNGLKLVAAYLFQKPWTNQKEAA